MKVGIIGFGVVGKKRYASILENTSYTIDAISENNSLARKDIPENIEILDLAKVMTWGGSR